MFSKKLLPKELKEKYLLAENSFSKKEFHTLEIRLEFVFISGILRHFWRVICRKRLELGLGALTYRPSPSLAVLTETGTARQFSSTFSCNLASILARLIRF